MIIYGISIGMLSGVAVGILTMISDGIFYTKYITNNEIAREYSNPLMQLTVFMAISIVYGGVQGGIFAWMIPILPADWLPRGLVFAIVSYLILSRHFVEGFAFMNSKYMPTRLSVYLSIEFFFIYTLQSIIVSRIMI